MLNSNPGPLTSEATAMPTVLQPLHTILYFILINTFFNLFKMFVVKVIILFSKYT